MRVCIKDLYDHEGVKNCSKCRTILLKTNFHKDRTEKYGQRPKCNSCLQEYYYASQNRFLNDQNFYKREPIEKNHYE